MSRSAREVASPPQEESCEIRLVDAATVDRTKQLLPSPGELDALADWFKMLGDPTRARILYAVLEAGELCVCDLAATVDVPESTVSHALRWLRRAGAVTSRRSGRMVYYRLADGHVRALLDVGREHVRHLDGHRTGALRG